MNEYTSGEQFISQDTVTGGDASCPVKSFDMNVLRSNNPIEDSHAEAIIRLGSKVPTYFLFFSIYPDTSYILNFLHNFLGELHTMCFVGS